MNSIYYIAGYFIIINIMGFASMGIDKRRAIRSAYRIPEATLFAIALVGGSLGSNLGMRIFRHKTKHWYFNIGMPIILLVQVAILVFLILSPLQFSFM